MMRSKGGARGRAAALLVGTVLLAPAPSAADLPDWDRVADEAVIEVITRDEDGDARETKVWFVLVDGQAYLRTNGSRWLSNLRRDPDCALRIRGVEYPARAVEVSGEDWVERVDAASLAKYGWQERLIHPFRMRTPEILRLTERAPAE